ncbi:MAG TPA: universal stress protein [Oligoflexia bacterium]|nr:universal stress protein [Oligoflexia bacterium]HMP47975.1 universal stress protein [Oligoflexia bacterium]
MNILLTTDFSKDSEAAIDYTLKLAIELKSFPQLTVLHCIDYLSSSRLYYGLGIDIENILLNSEEEANKLISEIKFKFFNDKMNVNTKVLRSERSVGSEIVRYAEQNKFDLLIISRKGQTALAHVLFGSVSEYVVRHASVPVILVPVIT